MLEMQWQRHGCEVVKIARLDCHDLLQSERIRRESINHADSKRPAQDSADGGVVAESGLGARCQCCAVRRRRRSLTQGDAAELRRCCRREQV